MKTYVIAEAGSCGDGELAKMLAQIKLAATAGASAVKFQWTSDAGAMADRRNATADGYEAVYAKYLQWDRGWHRQLADACRIAGVDYMCAVYLAQDISTVEPYVKHFKVSSFESTDLEFLRAHAPFMDDPTRFLLISTGMCSKRDLIVIEQTCCSRWLRQAQLVLLHCTTAYPTAFAELHLRALRMHDLHGYSDHTPPEMVSTGSLAVAAGARFIEAHVRLPETDPDNPDAPHAMLPVEFVRYVAAIGMAESALGSGEKGVKECELPMHRYKVEKPKLNLA